MNPEERLVELNLTLPAAPSPAGSYVPSVETGNLLYTAGAICIMDGEFTHTGKIGESQTVESGYEAARVCALNNLAVVKAALGSLDRVSRVVSVTGFVNAVDGFTQSPEVINGASDLFVSVFGEIGKHARAAVSVSGLPRNSTVEVQIIVEVREECGAKSV